MADVATWQPGKTGIFKNKIMKLKIYDRSSRALKWNKIDSDKFSSLYPDISNKELANLFGVSMSSVKNYANKLDIEKSAEYMSSGPGQFRKGHQTWNKNIKGIHVSRETEFKPGHIPANTKYNGCISLRIRNDNKRRDEKYYFIRLDKMIWIQYQRYLWEKYYGAIPEGRIVVFKDRDTLNVSLDNLELITRTENMDRNRNYEKSSRKMKETWRIERLRVKYGLQQQTKLRVNNCY